MRYNFNSLGMVETDKPNNTLGSASKFNSLVQGGGPSTAPAKPAPVKAPINAGGGFKPKGSVYDKVPKSLFNTDINHNKAGVVRPAAPLNSFSYEQTAKTPEPKVQDPTATIPTDKKFDYAGTQGLADTAAAGMRAASVDQPLAQGEEDYNAGKDIAMGAGSAVVAALPTALAMGATAGTAAFPGVGTLVGAAVGLIVAGITTGISVKKKKEQSGANKKTNNAIRTSNRSNRQRQRVNQRNTDAMSEAQRVASELADKKKNEAAYGTMTYEQGGVVGYSQYLASLKKKVL